MHVFLTGFMGAGKSTVGKVLAELLDRPFVDLDSRIEAEQGTTIAELFEHRGEAGFRQLESAALRAVESSVAAVVATGGGVLTVLENRMWMETHGTTVWLDVSFENLLERLRPEEIGVRPLFDSAGEARLLYESRRAEYGDSDLRIEVSSSHSVAEVAALIRERLEERECVT